MSKDTLILISSESKLGKPNIVAIQQKNVANTRPRLRQRQLIVKIKIQNIKNIMKIKIKNVFNSDRENNFLTYTMKTLLDVHTTVI